MKKLKKYTPQLNYIDYLLIIGVIVCLIEVIWLDISSYPIKNIIIEYKNQTCENPAEIYNCPNQTKIIELPCEIQICDCGQELRDCEESWQAEVETLWSDLDTCCDYCYGGTE